MIRSTTRRLVAALFALVASLSFASDVGTATADPGARAPAAPVDAAQWPLVLGPYLEIHEDVQGRASLADVRGLDGAQWRRNGADVPHFALSHSVWWLRWRLHNTQAAEVQRLVGLSEPLQDRLELFVVAGDGRVTALPATGDRLPFATRVVDYHQFVFPVAVAAGDTAEVYLRIQAYDGLHDAVPLSLWDSRSFFERAADERLVYGLYYGALLALLLYNLFLFVSTRERLYASYVAYVSVFFVWNFAFRGFGFQHFWPDSPWFANQIVAVGTLIAFMGFTDFSVRYLQTRRLTPRVHRVLRGLMVAQLFCLLPPLAGYYAASWLVIIPVGVVSIGVVAGTAMTMAARGSREARFWLLAWTGLAVGIVLYYLRMMGVLPSTALTEYGLQIGSTFEFLLLAFGLADRMNKLEAEKLQAEQEMVAAKSSMNQRLEQQVSERTRELQAANGRLAEMAITDELTGAFNRRHFNEVFAHELQRQSRGGGTLALVLFDVDHFKAYNDRYGHPAGDAALRAVAATVMQHSRRATDRFFRVGGEEFALLLHPANGEGWDFADTIRACIQALAIPHEGSAHRVVTVSMGAVVVLAEPGSDCDAREVYARADALLYEAKASGRNRVCTNEGPKARLPVPA